MEARSYAPGPAAIAAIRAELEEALQEDPLNAEAVERLAGIDEKKPDVERLRAITKARPADSRGWAALAAATADDAERRLAVRKAAELNPDSSRAQAALAHALLEEGKNKEALAAANRAMDLAPWDPYMIETLGSVAASLGKCPEALQLQRRAERIFVQHEQDLDGARKRTATLEERCAKRAPGN